MRSWIRFEAANTGRPPSKWMTFSAAPAWNTTRPVKSPTNIRAISAGASATPRTSSPPTPPPLPPPPPIDLKARWAALADQLGDDEDTHDEPTATAAAGPAAPADVDLGAPEAPEPDGADDLPARLVAERRGVPVRHAAAEVRAQLEPARRPRHGEPVDVGHRGAVQELPAAADPQRAQRPGVDHAVGLGPRALHLHRIDARLAEQGLDTLVSKAISGFQGTAGVMPAKGGNPALTDEQVKATVEWMVAQAK